MKPYLALLAARFKQGLQYRAAAWAGSATQLCFGIFLVSALEAFAAAKPGALAAFPSTASYVWLGQALFFLMPWNPDPELRDAVRLGEVGLQLAKPLDLYWAWFARALGFRLSATSLRALPCLIASGLLLPLVGLGGMALKAPVSAAAALAFLAALPGAVLLSAAITTGYAIFYFRSVSAGGAMMLATAAASLCGGNLAPLPLLPSWMGDSLALTPYAFVTDAPFRLWTGISPPGGILRVLAFQAAWTAVIVAFGRAWLARRVAGVEMAGG
jgi:ABC-2 type transport system permease protein